MLVQFGNNWIQKIPLTAKLDSACGLIQFWLSSEFFSSNYFQIGQHVVLLHIQIDVKCYSLPEKSDQHLFSLVADVIAKSKFLEDKLARELDHTSHRVIKTWEHLACTEEVNAPLETRLRCKLNCENSCTQMLIDFITVEMEDKRVYHLIKALRDIKRHDVVKIITDVYSGMFDRCPFLMFLLEKEYCQY